MWEIEKKRPSIEDLRGYLIEFDLDGWQQANILFSKKDVVRGCHFHKLTTELFYVIEGKLLLELRSLKSHEKHSEQLLAGSKFIIPPFTWHKLTFVCDTHLMTFYDMAFDPLNPDLYQI